MKYKIEKIGNLIDEISVKNQNLAYKNLIGLNIQKEFIPSIANQNDLDLSKYKIDKNYFSQAGAVQPPFLIDETLLYPYRSSFLSELFP